MCSELVSLISPYKPCATAALYSGQVITQQQMLSDLTVLADKLSDERHLINLCSDRYHFLLGFSAALVNGALNILPPNTQTYTLKSISQQYPSHCVLIDSDKFANLPHSMDIRELTFSSNADHRGEPPAIPVGRSAAIAFTSGSTGEPKPIDKQWGTLVGTAKRLNERFRLNSEVVPHGLATVPSQHMYGLEMTAMMTLQAGWALHSAHPFFPQDIAEALNTIPAPRVLVTTPVHLRILMGSNIVLPSLDLVISATAPLTDALALDVEQKYAVEVKEIYGCTEGGSLASRRTVDGDTWQLLNGIKLTQSNDECFVDSDHLIEKTRLSDLLAVLSNDKFNLLGRSSDMLNVGGKRASLADVNQKLMGIDGVDDCAVFVPDKRGQGEQRPAALVVSSTLSEGEILDKLSSLLDPVFLPRPLRKISTLPRNGTGKLPIKLLSELLQRESR